VQRLGAAEHRGQPLHRDADQVDLRLLRGELHAGGLGVEAQHHRLRVLRAELVAHDLRPDRAAARNFATSSSSVVRLTKKKDSCAAKSSTARPAATAAGRTRSRRRG
jgi:hypothetical protein